MPVISIQLRDCFLSLLICLLWTNNLDACECIPSPVCERIAQASTVFVGTVLDDGSQVVSNQTGRLKVRVAVDEAFKGLRSNARQVEGSITPVEDCGTPLIKGRRYLIFAGGLGDQLQFNIDCNSTILYREASDLLQYLRSWAKGETPTVLRGFVRADVEETLLPFAENNGLAEVEILANGLGKQYRSVTDSAGNYEIRGLVPGPYEITAQLSGYVSSRASYSVSVAPGACSRLEIAMWNSCSLSGTLYDEAGVPAKGIRVELAPLTEGHLQPAKEAATDPEGKYRFTKIPPDNYLLGVNLAEGINAKTPYATRFYPGVSSRDRAAVLRIEGGQDFSGYDFQLEKRHPTRMVRVLVKWWNGQPATNVSIKCKGDSTDDSEPKTEWSKRYTNQKGETQFPVLNDKGYDISTDELFWLRTSRPVKNCQTVQVPAGEDPVRVELVISRDNDFRPQEAPVDMSHFNE